MARWQMNEDGVEPVSDSWGEIASNSNQYGVFSGNEVSYSVSDMVATVAAGTVIFGFAGIDCASGTGTLVSDPTNPRWTWITRDSTGAVVIVSGDPAAIPAVPELGGRVPVALVLVQAAQTIAGNITTKLDKRIPRPTLSRYSAATQTFSASTSLLDVITAGTTTTASFWADASAIYKATYHIPLTFTGTGGFKAQVSGPTIGAGAISITGTAGLQSGGNVNMARSLTAVTAFAANITAFNAAATGAEGTTYESTVSSMIDLHAVYVMGATAGLVTLQAAQNSANGTTVLGVGTTMTVDRIG
jgi:hypothetical protein